MLMKCLLNVAQSTTTGQQELCGGKDTHDNRSCHTGLKIWVLVCAFAPVEYSMTRDLTLQIKIIKIIYLQYIYLAISMFGVGKVMHLVM